MKVRHAKILFCGASGAGKTSFVRLLKNEKFRDSYHSTGLGNTQQIMMSKKATLQGAKWIDLNPVEELKQMKLRMYHKLVTTTKSTDEDKQTDSTENKIDASADNLSSFPQKFDRVATKGSAKFSDSPSRTPMNSVTTERRLCSKSPNLSKDFEKPPPVWDILTLLGTGGQPQFINMLPAVNTSATFTFVVLNMLHVLGVKGFDERVQVHHYRNGIKSYEPYALNYTNKDLIKCLTALLKDSIVRDIPLPGVAVSKPGRDKPGLCFVGTHLDRVKREDVDTINQNLVEIVSNLEPNDNVCIWNCDDKILFPVDNTIAGNLFLNDTLVNEIHFEIRNVMDTKAVYEVPITWMILEMEIRFICNTGNRLKENKPKGKSFREKGLKGKESGERKPFMSISEVVELYQNIVPGCDKRTAEIQATAALRFHHMFGVLLYFHEVPGMNNFVISDPQWLFTNLTDFVCCSFDGRIIDHKALDKLKSEGILDRSLIEKINIHSLGGIDLDIFLELLKYLNIITPYPTNNSSDYLMLTILDSYKGEEDDLFHSLPPLDGVEFVVQFNSGTFPRGQFCCLIVKLVQETKEWCLQFAFLNKKKCIYSNLVVFCIYETGQYVLLLDKTSHLEICVTKSQYKGHFKSIHFDVQQRVIKALQQINMKSNGVVSLQYGFYCKSKPCLVYLPSDHIDGSKPLPPGLPCKYHGLIELTSHKQWCENPNLMVWLI